LEYDFICEDVEACADRQDLATRLVALAFQRYHGALPDLVVLLSEASQFVEDRAVQSVEKSGGFLQLFLLDFRECFA
jgi:hypothetical protein